MMAEEEPISGSVTAINTPTTSSVSDNIQEGLRHRFPARRPSVTLSTEEEEEGEGESIEGTSTALSEDMATLVDSVTTPVDNNNSDPFLSSRQATQEDYYSCNICFDAAIEPVLTVCGHLYCWPCLHQWLDAQRLNPLCPVCKAGCGSDKVIPIYGRGREATDPRLKNSIPDRPAGQRPLPQQPSMGSRTTGIGWQGNTLWSGIAFQQQLGLAAGFGLFPWQFNWFYMGSPHGRFHPEASASVQQTFMSRIFFMFGVLFFMAIVLS
ncbi:hypothetical protein BDF19DRAFT_428793 [Syncephalis fuscata]|nr:hypothetical protein BDF19DRAFT_428793 [Syncephalis fuscata]